MDNKSLYFPIRLYLDYLNVMHYAERTVVHRDVTLSQFTTWCEERGLSRSSEITKPILERYRRYLHNSRDKRGNPLSAKNQLARLIPLRSFLNGPRSKIIYSTIPRVNWSYRRSKSVYPKPRSHPKKPSKS